MKHLYILLLFLFFAFFPSARSVKAENMMIDIEVNGTKIYTDSAPFIKNGSVYVPIRAISEALGLSCTWDSDSRFALVEGSSLFTRFIPLLYKR